MTESSTDLVLFETSQAFRDVMLDAVAQCDAHSAAVGGIRILREEQGGIIFEQAGKYEFARMENIHTGTPTAIGLWEVDMFQFGKLLQVRLQGGWKLCASFHTHPSFSPTPSSLDHDVLFQSYAINVIWSPRNAAFSFNHWEGENLMTQYVSKTTIQQLNT